MDKIEKKFQDELRLRLKPAEFIHLTKNRKPIYDAILATLRSVNDDNVQTDYLTLLKPNINKLNLKPNKYNVYIFCGCFIIKGMKVIVLEKSETVGTYYLKGHNLVKQLEKYKIGLKIGLEVVDNVIKISTPAEEIGGLFEE